MAHTLTETATFDASITVPDDLDTATQRASVGVTGPVQALANRTQFLNAAVSNAARTDVANTFTSPQTFSGGIHGATSFDGTLHADGGISTDSTLHAHGNMDTDGTLHADGAIDSDSSIHADGAITGSTTLVITGASTLHGVTNTGDISTSGTLNTHDISATGALTVGGNINAALGTATVSSVVALAGVSAATVTTTGNIESTGGDVIVHAPNRVRYSSAITVHRTIPMCGGVVTAGGDLTLANAYWQSNGAGGTVQFPLGDILPSDAVINSALVQWLGGTTNAFSFQIKVIDWSLATNASLPTASDIATPTTKTGTSTTVLQRDSVSGGGHPFDPTAEDIWLSVTLGTGTGNKLVGLQITYTTSSVQ
jgi:hypothetical protein